MKTLLFVLLLALAGGFAAPACAAPDPTLRFEHLSVEDGLAQESVLAMAQDSDGFMWFGTQNGLSRFDGYRFVNFRNVVGDPSTLASNWIRVLHVDPQGRLWIGTDGGLARYDAATQSFQQFLPEEPARRGNGNRHVRAVIDDGKGGLWLGTGDGLQHFDIASGRFTTWHHAPGDPDGLASDDINALVLDRSGLLWIGSSAGVDSFDPSLRRFTHHAGGKSAPDNVVNALLVDAANTLWIGSLGGVDRMALAGPEVGRRQRLGPEQGIPRAWITALYQDVQGQVWVGAHDEGLYRWDAQRARFEVHRQVVADSHSLADNHIAALYRDRVGTFWVGTWYAGVSRVDLGSGGFARIVRERDGAGTADNRVKGIENDGGGKLWLASTSSLQLYDPAAPGQANRIWRHEPHNPNSLIDTSVNAVVRDRQGLLWVGGRTGITSFDPKSGRFVRQVLATSDSNASNANNVRAMSLGRDGMVWIATKGGLHMLDPATRQVTSYRHDPARQASLADNMVRPVLEDRRGRLWVGTFNGLDLLDRASGRFRHFRHDGYDPTSLSHDEIHYLMEDRAGNIWVGTAVGLNKMVTAADGSVSFVRYTMRDGLVDDAVAAMLEDADGAIWISTTNGLSRFEPATNTWRSYTAADGTVDGAYFDAAAARAPDGSLYFGGFNGITAFDPRALRYNRIAPRAVITGFQIFNRPVQQSWPELLDGPIENARTITLSAKHSVFSLEFSALHYAAPKRNRFAYKLEGFDQAWVNADAGKRFATYTNLDPGRYVFHVRAANKDGVWSETPATLEIVIEPPAWGTWWFRIASILMLLSACYAGYRLRTRSLRRQQLRLERQVGARTEEIGLQNRLLERQTAELREREQQVRQNTIELGEANRALHENERRLQLAARRAEDAARQKSEFLANMSHEMRTPLAGVIGMLGFALRDGQLKESTREQIARGQANAEALLAIINDLLDFSKIEAGKLTVETIDFALDAAIGNVAALFEEQAAALSIDFAIELAPDLPRFVQGDPTRLRQVLVNLVGNAFKFTPAGQVLLRVERRPEDQPDAAQQEAPHFIRFSVQDTGIGIAAEALPRLFQKFEQADATTTRRYGGTGLGLAICRQLVELMNGSIEAHSAPGEGSTFSFVLPMHDGAEPVRVEAAPRLPHTHRLRVLCAEDFATNQIIARMMVEDMGHSIDVVENGALAVAACARAAYDIVLMDGRMPEIDGATATRLIRAGGTLDAPVLDPRIMIVALTANASDEDRDRYLACGMDAFLAKPIDEAALHRQFGLAIERQLARGIALAPMDAPPPSSVAAASPSTAELDALFGIAPEEAAPAQEDRAAELQARLHAAFAADLPRRRRELRAAVDSGDDEGCARVLHGLRGSAGHLGAGELAVLCARLEKAADSGRRDELLAGLARLDALLDAFATSLT
ncbi:two-component regulator propeller domain-containing protein [Massilia sp.]|uniref:hybrid sensor histidine kinase/response regulator n=1 Tax=Massilia sp. TaxID=1882437 RepID=UPI0028AC15A5|nr:two-component regulator propeller domain-containing protein [Massilia sp.]